MVYQEDVQVCTSPSIISIFSALKFFYFSLKRCTYTYDKLTLYSDQRRALRQEKATDDVSLSTVAAAATTKPSTGTARAATQPPAATEPPATTTNSQDLIQISESVWRKGVYSAKKHPEKTRAILANTTRRIEDICERIEATFTAVESFPQNEPVPTETAGPKTKESSVQSAGRSSIGSQPPPVVLDPKPRRHQRSSSPTAAPKLPSVVETPGFHPLLERSQAPQTLADEELLAQAQDLSKGLTDQESILLRSLENDKTGKARLAEPLPQTPLRGKADYGVSALQKSPGRASTSSTPGQGLSRQRLLKSTSMRESTLCFFTSIFTTSTISTYI